MIAHGVHDGSRERPAGLVLASAAGGEGAAEATGAVAWCEDLERSTIAPCVVLASCGAARGPLRRGDDGIAGLAGALHAGGARAVVLSRSDVEYRATLRLVAAFLARVADGAAPAEALRAARAELLRDRSCDPAAALGVFLTGLGAEPAR